MPDTPLVQSHPTAAGIASARNVDSPWYEVVASDYTGSTGAYGNLDQSLTYAELSHNYQAGTGGDFSAMGKLAPGTELQISYHGKTVIAVKKDVGAGGPGIGPLRRVIDLHSNTAAALGFNGLGIVKIRRVDGQPMNIAGSKQVSTSGLDSTVPNAVNSAVNTVSSAVSSVPDALNAIAKTFAFLFSKQFLYIIGGGALLLVALVLVVHTMMGGGQGPRPKIPIPIPE